MSTYKEINQEFPTKLKLQLGYRQTPTVVAIIAFVFGVLISITKLSDFDFREYYNLKFNTSVAIGKVTNAYYTGIHGTIGDDEGHYYINAFVYEYTINNELHKWLSYSRNATKKVGDKVYIKYNLNSPQYSVIKGYDYRPNGASAIYLLLIPSISFLILLYHMMKGIYFSKIINQGILTKGRLINKTIIVDGDTITYYQLTFEYFSDIRKKESQKISVITSETTRFLDQAKEYIIFNRKKPKQAVIVDNLPLPVSNYIKKHWS